MIVAITPTGGRQQAFALCEQYMARQTLLPDIWIVVDDCDPPTRMTQGQTVIRPEPRWQHYCEPNSQHRNIEAALEHVGPDDAVIMWEDDDWYGPHYIERQAARLRSHDLVGEIPARYYRVDKRAHRTFNYTPHASLCATALCRGMIQRLREACQCRAWIDMYLWRTGPGKRRLAIGSQVVGIKGMPGRRGVSEAHRQSVDDDDRWHPDPSLDVLRRWIGSDARAYSAFVAMPVPQWTDYSRENEQMQYETFMVDGQVRYRCPQCPYDHYRPSLVTNHIGEIHIDDRLPVGVPTPVLFDADGKVITRKIIVER
jgi:hypothetical protein